MSVLASYVDTFSKNSKITFPSFTINLRHALHLLPPFTPLSCSILILPFVASIYNTVLNLFPEDINNFTGSSTFLEHLAQCYLNHHLISSSVSLRTQGFFTLTLWFSSFVSNVWVSPNFVLSYKTNLWGHLGVSVS